MRAHVRRRSPDEEEESVFVSMTDMTISFLFIVMILLAFFASQYNPTQSVPRPEYDRVVTERDQAQADLQVQAEIVEKLRKALAQALQARDASELALSRAKADQAKLVQANDAKDVLIKALELQIFDAQAKIASQTAALAAAREHEQFQSEEIARMRAEIERLTAPDPLENYINLSLQERRHLLERLRADILHDFPDIGVEISEQFDALRFQGDGLFRSGSATLRPDRVDFVRSVAARLQSVLPCYTLGPEAAWDATCNASHAVIEAVQIEGHTDADGGDITNLQLSTARANATFVTMLEAASGLTGHLNLKDQPVMSVAGYGEMRPVAMNDTPEGKASNRRIDLRIIMYVPNTVAEIDQIRAKLEAR
ncbi:OmpA family protein [Rhodobacter sp. KR11]|uniref:OmpA family protein n=1 Tax=Rhodobacter sp. KR11 TaxID=2974588 RepID=UPI0022224CA4|nr:OmpA family protein [Rhodobacter sp. KR11]MCW1918026.1 OmpA family protein [Rhodobacter sp. KR11]